MEVNDTRKALLANEVKLQYDTLSAEVNVSVSGNNTIELSDEWTAKNNYFSNTKVERIEKTSIEDLYDIPEGVVYDSINDTLSFVDESLSKYFSSDCKIEGTNTVSLNSIVSDITVFESLEKINNFGDVYDFQFRQIDFSTHKYANVKTFINFNKIIGFFSVDKLLNDELIRKNNQDALYNEYVNTDQTEKFPKYSGFLVGTDYLENGWVSIDQIIKNAYNNDYAYDNQASMAIRTPKINDVKKALITLTLSYVCDIYNLNSFNKFSDFGVRIIDKTTQKELSVTTIKNDLIEKITSTLVATYSGGLTVPTNTSTAQELDINGNPCKKVKTNKCDGSLFTTKTEQNPIKEIDGFIHEIDAQVKLNPFKAILTSKPDILNTIDPIHWTTGVNNLSQTGELFNLIKEFGQNTYNCGRLNEDRAFAYGAGDFTNGLAVGGYHHNSEDIKTTNTTEAWNGISWSLRSECPVDTACGLAGGNQDLAVISYGINNSWTNDDKSYNNYFKPSSGILTTSPLFFQNNSWQIMSGFEPEVPRHSLAGVLNIKYDQSTPGESIDKYFDKDKFFVCNEAISKAKQFSSQKFSFSSESTSTSGSVQTPNTSPKVWFDIWQCNGIAFGGSNENHVPLDEIREKTNNQTGITDEFETISWVLVTKSTNDIDTGETVQETDTFGCRFIDPIRKYPVKAMGISYVGTSSSGIATGGKTSNSLSNSTIDNVKVNMKNYYFDSSKFNIDNLSVTPYCYENNGISWIRRENLPEPTYYHAGVGNNEYALFFGGIHASLENPQVYTAFKNCQDWETLINLYGGSFARNGSYSIDGNLRYSSFSNIFDANSKGAEDSYGNKYFKNRDVNNEVSSTVEYSSEYLSSGNETVYSLYPNITNFLEGQDPEFTFPNKQIHSKAYHKLVYKYDKRYFVLDTYSITYDLAIDKKVIESYEHISFDLKNEKITVKVPLPKKQEVLDYFNALTYISLDTDETVVLSAAFEEGYNKVISLSEESPSNKPDISIFEDKLTNSNINELGKFTYYLSTHISSFAESYTKYGQINKNIAANKENYFINLSPKFSGHPSDGGLWLVSRPSKSETLFDPKSFLNDNITLGDLISNGFSSGSSNKYTYFVKPAIYEKYNNKNVIINYKDSGLYQYLEKKDDGYTINEFWSNEFGLDPNNQLRVNTKSKVTRTNYEPTEIVPIPNFPRKGTISNGVFTNWSSNYTSYINLLTEFSNAQFSYPEIILDRDLIHVQMYDNDLTKYLGNGQAKTSCIRDKAGLWPWNDLLEGDSSNDCIKGDYTYRWDYSGNILFAFVENVEIDGSSKIETIKLTKYANDGKKVYDYTITYREILEDSELLALKTKLNRDYMVFEGSGTENFNDYLTSKKTEYGIFNIFGKDIRRQTVKNDAYNGLHVYGGEQNYETSDRTVLSYNWKKTCHDEFTTDTIKSYPYKYTNLCELIKENDLYNNTDRYQIYLEGYSYGGAALEVKPIEPWYNPIYFNVKTKTKNKIPPQMLTQDLCGIRENLLKLRYHELCLSKHSGLLFGDIRVMGEAKDKCYLPSNCSIIACGDTPMFNKDYDGKKGQPEYFIDRLTRRYGVEWVDTGIGTDFTSNLYARFRRDVAGENVLETLVNDIAVYPHTYKDEFDNLWTPLDIAKNPKITDNRTLYKKPNVVVFCGGVFDVMYDKNFYETIYFLEEIAKKANEYNIWIVFLTIPPRAMMQYPIAIERSVWYNNLVGDGRLNDPVSAPVSSSKTNPVSGDKWNVPMSFGQYAGLEDPFVGKTKLEKLIAINEWMKENLIKYDHDVLDAYDTLADKSAPAENQHKMIYNTDTKTITVTEESVYGFIDTKYSNGRFANTQPTQFNGLINHYGSKTMMKLVFDSVDLIPRLGAKLMDFDGNVFDPKEIFKIDFPMLANRPTDSYFDLHKVGVENTYLSYDKLGSYNPTLVREIIKLNPGECGEFSALIHKVCYESLYFDLLCCLLKQDTCYANCYSSVCDILGENADNPKYKWIQHNHEEWTVPILESPFAGPFSTTDFNVWLKSGNVKNNRWGTNIWSTVEGGVITLHHRKQRIGINDPQAGYALVDGVWTQINKSANRGHLYYASITTEVKIENIETAENTQPTPCRVFYDEFIFDLAAYSESGLNTFIKEIVRVSYPSYTGTDLIPSGKEYNTTYEILGLDCDESVSVYRPVESQLNPYASGVNLCGTEAFSYTEWVTNFVQEMKNNKSLRKSTDQKEDKYFSKYDINRPFGSTTYKDSDIIELTSDIKIVDTEWRRYQDGVGLGGDIPILNVTDDNKLKCNTLNTWYVGQTAFGTPDKAIVFGGFEFTPDNGDNGSHSWWENYTTNLTFKWNKFVISPEDTFNTNYMQRGMSSNFSNKEPTTAKSSLGMILFDLTNDVLVERQGTAIFDKQNSATITLDLPDILINKDKYSITLTPSDNINCWWEEKSATSFVIKVDAEEWSGSVEWFVTINDKVDSTSVDQNPNMPYSNYEEI